MERLPGIGLSDEEALLVWSGEEDFSLRVVKFWKGSTVFACEG